MTATILITGFGSFPGAPFNPTGILVEALAQRRHPAFASVHRLHHVFQVSYETVDRELPKLLESTKPHALMMFGLAERARHVRIETRARNALTRALPDSAGYLPLTAKIDASGPSALPLHSPAQRLLLAARSAGLPAALSRDAGRYLCNYLCWRAAQAARNGAPRLIAFIHVPRIHPTRMHPSRRPQFTLDDLLDAGEAMLRAMIAAAR